MARENRYKLSTVGYTPTVFAANAQYNPFDINFNTAVEALKLQKKEHSDAVDQQIARDLAYSQARNSLNQEDASTLFFDNLIQKGLDDVAKEISYGHWNNVSRVAKQSVSDILNNKRFQFLANAEDTRRKAIKSLDDNSTISDRTRTLYKDNYNQQYKDFMANYIATNETSGYSLTDNFTENIALKDFTPQSVPVADLDIAGLVEQAAKTQKPDVIAKEEDNYSTNLPERSNGTYSPYTQNGLESSALITRTRTKQTSSVTNADIAKSAVNIAKNNPNFAKQAYQLYMGDKHDFDAKQEQYNAMSDEERNSEDGKALSKYLDKERYNYYCNGIPRVNNQVYYEKYTEKKIREAVEASGYAYTTDIASKSDIMHIPSNSSSGNQVDKEILQLGIKSNPMQVNN